MGIRHANFGTRVSAGVVKQNQMNFKDRIRLVLLHGWKTLADSRRVIPNSLYENLRAWGAGREKGKKNVVAQVEGLKVYSYSIRF